MRQRLLDEHVQAKVADGARAGHAEHVRRQAVQRAQVGAVRAPRAYDVVRRARDGHMAVRREQRHALHLACVRVAYARCARARAHCPQLKRAAARTEQQHAAGRRYVVDVDGRRPVVVSVVVVEHVHDVLERAARRPHAHAAVLARRDDAKTP